MTAQARLFGGILGVTIATAITNHHSQTVLTDILSPSQIRSLQFAPGILKTLSDVQQEAVRTAIAQSFNLTMRACLYIAAAGLISTLFMWQRNPPVVGRQRRLEQTNQ
jgi:hypothetical protein